MSILDVYASNSVKEKDLFALPLSITVSVMMLKRNPLVGQIKKMKIVAAKSIAIVFLGLKIVFAFFMIIAKLLSKSPNYDL